jgi:sulfur carrier protein ThiS
VTGGMTVEQFFGKQLPGCKPEDYLIRVNRQPVAKDHILQEGDRITMTPVKIEGAA